MRLLFVVLCFGLCFTSCQNEGASASTTEKSVKEIKADSKIDNSKVVRNPVNAEGPIDTVNVAKMVFDEEEFNYGTVKQGDVVQHSFSFTNTGKVPLIISNARSTCGCTVPEKPDGPIAPGEKGVIKVKFNTRGKSNRQEKPIIITANTYPKETKTYIKGFVEVPAKPKTAAKN